MPSRPYRWLLVFFRLLVRAFFRQVEVSGLDRIPLDRGGILVSWHPNGLIDPGLILTQFPSQVIFGARHGLFRWPLFGWALRQIGTVPIVRAADANGSDASTRRDANRRSLDALAQRVADGAYSALFPEGVSHDRPHPVELKTGAARMYYRARALHANTSEPPVLIPVGLHYDQKRVFRSRALVTFHPPLELPKELDVKPPLDENYDAGQERARDLTGVIEKTLHEVVHATEDWRLHQLMHRCRTLIRAERAHRADADPGRPEMREKSLGFARVRAGYLARLESDPDRVNKLRTEVERYDADMRALGIEDHEIDRDPGLARPWMAFLLLLQLVLYYFLLPPIAAFGLLVNGPTALLLQLLSKAFSKEEKDEASIKILFGAVLFPATWAIVGLLGFLGHEKLHAAYSTIPNVGIIAGITVACVAAFGGVLSLRYLSVAGELARSVRVRLTRIHSRRSLSRLRAKRAELNDKILEMAEGLDLPGVVTSDGSVRGTSQVWQDES